MIITKMALPRRTFLRGIGADWRCRCWTRWCRRCRPCARRPRPGPRVSAFSTCRTARSADYCTRPVRAGIRALADLQPARAVQRPAGRRRAGSPTRRRTPGRRQRRAFASASDLVERRAGRSGPKAPTSRRARRSIRLRRSMLGQGDAADFAGDRPGSRFVVGNCDNGYSCVYTNTISWRTPTTPMPMETNPRAVFERLFGEGGTAARGWRRCAGPEHSRRRGEAG